MFRIALTFVSAIALSGLTASQAAAQGGGMPAAQSYLRDFAINSRGTNLSVSDMIQNSRNVTEGRGVSNGIVRNFQSTGAPVSSGVGRTSSRASIPTVPGGGRSSKPFSSVRPDSTVSPYLNLFNTGVGGAASSFDNYNTLVRPQLRQQNINRQLQRQTQQLNARVQQISAQPAFQPQGSQQMMATGHSTVFGYYSRFYPSKAARR